LFHNKTRFLAVTQKTRAVNRACLHKDLQYGVREGQILSTHPALKETGLLSPPA
jgi:hypothetical protein